MNFVPSLMSTTNSTRRSAVRARTRRCAAHTACTHTHARYTHRTYAAASHHHHTATTHPLQNAPLISRTSYPFIAFAWTCAVCRLRAVLPAFNDACRQHLVYAGVSATAHYLGSARLRATNGSKTGGLEEEGHHRRMPGSCSFARFCATHHSVPWLPHTGPSPLEDTNIAGNQYLGGWQHVS